MQTRSAPFAANADALQHESVILVRAYLAGGTRYWASRGGTYDGQAYEELLTQGMDMSLGLDVFGRTMRQSGRLVFMNGYAGALGRLSDLFATENFANRAVQVDLTFPGLAAADALRVCTGVLEVPEEDCFDDRELRLNIIDDGNPLHPGLAAINQTRIHKVLGTLINRTDFPGADPDAVGRVQPEIYGLVEESPCLAVDAGALDLLRADMTAAQNTVPLSDADAFALFPSSGTVVIEEEEITYTGKDASLNLTGCTRGTGGTTAAAHVTGRQAYEKQAEYTYIVARHACKSVANVKVDGVLRTSGYTVVLTGPTLIKFTAKPRVSLNVWVTQQPIHAAAVTAEQTAGVIATTAEQTPGAIACTTEHGHATAEGSHDHDTNVSLHEYQSSPSIPGTFTADQAVAFANTPKAGTTANFHIKLGSKQGTWQFRRGSTVLITLTGGIDNYFTDASPGTSYNFHITDSGSISIEVIERDITTLQASSADAAAGVLASRTGATASSMAALAGATASSMATLGGSTAVSVSRTTDVAVSAADVAIGRQVIADVEGYMDDGSGTYTGTPNALITNPSDQFAQMIAVQLGLTLADWRDSASFLQARSDFAAAAIRADWGLYDQLDSAELFERLRWSVASRLFLGAAGKFKLFVLPPGGSSVRTFTEPDDVVDEEHGGHAILAGRTSMRDLWNWVTVLYKRQITGPGYAEYTDDQAAASQTTYRTVNYLIIENDFIRNTASAQAVRDKYLAWHKDQKWRIRIPVWGVANAHLEPVDKIAITSPRMPGGWTAKEFYIESMAPRLGRPGQVDLMTLVCREV